MFKFYEFFAGGGMARAGLGPQWECVFANDYDRSKATSYEANWGAGELLLKDIHEVVPEELPGKADLAWASFPCQDLSCAGNGLGLGRERGNLKTRSGTFWPFIALMRELKSRRRSPSLIVLENVVGLLTTNSGADFYSVAFALADLDYRFGVLLIDAKHFVPQSRPRVFIVAVASGVRIPDRVQCAAPKLPWHHHLVVRAWQGLPAFAAKGWIWFDPGRPPTLQKTFADIVSDDATDVAWHTKAETKRLISLMSDANAGKLWDARRSGQRMVATVFMRMRPEGGVNRQRAEISFDDISGCIRTPKGGGSRPRVLVLSKTEVKSRLLSPREAATLMGVGPDYVLPTLYEPAYRLIGDGVVVPVVSFLRDRLLEPIASTRPTVRRAADDRQVNGKVGRMTAADAGPRSTLVRPSRRSQT